MKNFIRRYKFLLILTVIVLLVAIFYVVYNRIAVSCYIAQFEEKYKVQKEAGEDEINLYRVPGYHELLKQKGMLDGQVRLAQSDSVNLFLNLPERMAQLMIKGIGVRNMPVEEMNTGVLFERASDEALYNWLSEPLDIVGFEGTIEKQPVNVVIAPKDTSSNDEAPAVVPDTLQHDPVFFILETNRDLRLYVYETEQEDRWKARKFAFKYRWNEAREALKAVFSFRMPEYTPVLFIGLPQADAKAIYRALPHHGQVVITL